MKIDIQDLQDIVKIDRDRILRCAKAVLTNMKENNAELSLVFANDSHIRNLNQRYRGVNSSTDVLAFSMREGKGEEVNLQYRKRRKSLENYRRKAIFLLGDVVVSVETAEREAKKRDIPVQKEIELYLVHGILHLLGYDDEKVSDRKKMREKETEILGSFI